MQQKRNIKIVNITLYNFIARIVFFVFLFAASFYSSRVLNKTEFGKAQYLNWIVSFSWILFSLGGAAIITRNSAAAFMKHHFFTLRRILQYGLLSLIVSLLLVFAAIFFYSDRVQYAFSPVVFLLLFSQFLFNYLQAAVIGLNKYRTLFYSNLAAALSGGAMLFFFLEQYRVDAYLFSYFTVNAVLCTWYLVVIARVYFQEKAQSRPQPDDIPPSWSTLLRSAAYFALSAMLASVLWQRTEVYFIRQQLDFSSVATYGVALSVLALVTEPLRILPGALLSYFAGISDQQEKVGAHFYGFLRHFSWLVIFILLFVFFDADNILTLIYTDKYLDSVDSLRLLLLGFIPGICSYVVMNMHVGLGKARFLFVQDVLAALVFMGLLLVGLHYYGLQGAAAAKAIGICFTVMLGFIYTSRKLQLRFPFRQLAFSLGFSLLTMYPLRHVMDQQLWLIALKFVVLFAAYIFLSIRLQIIDLALVLKVRDEIRKVLRLS